MKLTSAATVALVLAQGACGSDANPGPPSRAAEESFPSKPPEASSSTSPPEASSSTSPLDAGAPDLGSTEDRLGIDLGYPFWTPRTERRGWLILFQSPGSLQGRHQFEFFEGADLSRYRSCEFRTVGPCILRSCVAADAAEPAQAFVWAGRMTASGDRSGRISYTPQIHYGTPYYNRHHQGKTWHNDDNFEISAEGGTVVAHKASIQFPARPADITAGSFSPTAGGSFRWTLAAGKSGQFVVGFPGTPQATCAGPNEAGALVIPAAAIAHVTAGRHAVKVRSAAWTNTRAGEFRIYVEARQEYQDLTVTVE